MLDTLERLILLQIGAAAVTRERVQEVVNRLIEQGRMEREEGRAVVEDVVTRARERSTGARGLIDASVQLEHRVRLLEDQSTEPGSEAPTEPLTSPVDEPVPPTPPASGLDVAPQPPRDEPDTPPGLQPGGN